MLLGTAQDLWDKNARVLSTRDMLLGEFLQWRERHEGQKRGRMARSITGAQ